MRDHHNHARYRTGQQQGHYESFWQRANHPSRPLAFWIRYTLFSPAGRPQDAIGELWAIWSDGERRALVVAKSEVPIAQCQFAKDEFTVRIADAALGPKELAGEAESSGHRVRWKLHYQSPEKPLFHLPVGLYDAPLPKAKSLVGSPLAIFNGELLVDGGRHEIVNWVGSQNHNWGSKHTDYYAYGQVAGFDNAPHSFLEIATARIKIGPFWTPLMTPLVLRHHGREYALNGIGRALRAKGSFGYFDWHFASEDSVARIEGRIHAPKDFFAALNYYNPPGGSKTCLNSKIAACELTLIDKRPGHDPTPRKLHTAHRAAFEMLTDDRTGHGVEVRA